MRKIRTTIRTLRATAMIMVGLYVLLTVNKRMIEVAAELTVLPLGALAVGNRLYRFARECRMPRPADPSGDDPPGPPRADRYAPTIVVGDEPLRRGITKGANVDVWRNRRHYVSGNVAKVTSAAFLVGRPDGAFTLIHHDPGPRVRQIVCVHYDDKAAGSRS